MQADGYSAKDVGNFFLSTYGKKSAISQLKLQKLVYLAHGWHLALYDSPLVSDENAEAWKHGPVFPSLYYEFRRFGRGAISQLAEDYTIDGATGTIVSSTIPQVNKKDKRVRDLLNRIWEVYGGCTAWELSAMTHKPGSPWEITRRKSGGKNNTNIADSDIQSHYQSLMNPRDS